MIKHYDLLSESFSINYEDIIIKIDNEEELSVNKIELKDECKDSINIHSMGLEEGIRCAMCTNPMANDRGCDGGCRVDENMYKKVLDVIYNHIIK